MDDFADLDDIEMPDLPDDWTPPLAVDDVFVGPDDPPPTGSYPNPSVFLAPGVD